jgi:hypothetical protein
VKELFTDSEFDAAKGFDFLPAECRCGKRFLIDKKRATRLRTGKQRDAFCTKECASSFHEPSHKVGPSEKICERCHAIFTASRIQRNNRFCSKACSVQATHENMSQEDKDAASAKKRASMIANLISKGSTKEEAESIGCQASPPFEGYRLYKVFHKNEQRQYACLVKDSEERTTISYARYLMSVSLGRLLLSDEHVDHIDNNKLNDAIENLQILTPEENMRKENSLRGVKTAVLTCPSCGKEFEREFKNTHLGKGEGSYTACSRQCSGRFSSHQKTGLKIPDNHIVKVYQKIGGGEE